MTASHPTQSIRDTAYRWLSLPVTERARIARVLGVLHEGQDYDDVAVMTEVKRAGLIDDLRAEMERR